MPTLRDHVKDTLAAREPDEATAKSDLDAVLARAERPRRRALWLAVPAFAAAAAAVALVLARPPSAPPPAAQSAGMYLYLHVDGEPADQAVTLDLDTKGSSK